MAGQRDWDAIVVGASFAGLAVARELPGEVLLVDRHEVGSVQTSACGTPLWVLRALGLTASVRQVHERLELRTRSHTIVYDLSDVPFCTFDYRAFTRGLLEQSAARFLRTPVRGFDGTGVETAEGRHTAPIVVDASGWRGVLVHGGLPPAAAGTLTFGLESPTPLRDDRLVFVLDKRVLPHGLAWIFPVGEGSLVGLGSYAGVSKLGPALRRFLTGLGTVGATSHGTFFPNRLLRPTARGIFAVGDAAGQCLPLTAEGIRPALYFGRECGRILRGVIAGDTPLATAFQDYAGLVERYRRVYRLLGAAQWLAVHAPERWFGLLAAAFGRRPLQGWWWPRYGLFGRFGCAPRVAPVLAG